MIHMRWNPVFVRVFVVALGAMATPGCMSMMQHVQGSGVSRTESRSVGPFSEIEASHAVQLQVVIGTPASVEVTTDDNIQQHVLTEVSGSKLKIKMDAGTTTKIGVNVRVVTPTLTELEASGAVMAKVSDLKTDQFQLELSGASKCTINAMTERFSADLSGASQCTLTGRSDRLKVKCSGASQFHGTEFPARSVDADANGASTIEVQATDELTAEASGASHVRFVGSPARLKKSASGASSIGPK